MLVLKTGSIGEAIIWAHLKLSSAILEQLILICEINTVDDLYHLKHKVCIKIKYFIIK